MSNNLSHLSLQRDASWTEGSQSAAATTSLSNSKSIVTVTLDSSRQFAPLLLAGILGYFILSSYLQATVFSAFRNLRRPRLQGKWSWIMGNLIGEYFLPIILVRRYVEKNVRVGQVIQNCERD